MEKSCDFMKSINLDSFSMLQVLSISFSEIWSPLHVLASFIVTNCQKLVLFPKRRFYSPRMKWFSISDWEKLTKLPEQMNTLLPSLESLHIWSCRELKSFPECPFPSNLHELDISKCNKFFASRRHWNLHKHSLLPHISIFDGQSIR